MNMRLLRIGVVIAVAAGTIAAAWPADDRESVRKDLRLRSTA
jgi:hypothetical protein